MTIHTSPHPCDRDARGRSQQGLRITVVTVQLQEREFPWSITRVTNAEIYLSRWTLNRGA